MTFDDPTSSEAAVIFLVALGASSRLTHHGETVAESATQLSAALAELGVRHVVALVEVASVLHDAGKIIYPEELDGPGNKHEAAGERLLIANGCSPDLARFCRSHGEWDRDDLTLEEIIVALADAIWKGERADRLEKLLIENVSGKLGMNNWETFLLLDPIIERIASGAEERLARERYH